MSTLRQRVLTAAVLIPALVAAVLWLPGAAFALVLGAFALAGAWEWGRVGVLPQAWRLPFCVLVAASLAGGYALAGERAVVLAVLAAALAWWLLALAWVVDFQRAREPAGASRALVRALAGWMLLVPCWLSLLHLHLQSPALVLYLLVLIWVADSAAYFAGRRFGRRRLAPRVSPGKSWEGVAGALLAVAALAAAAALARDAAPAAAAGFVALSLAAAMASVLGDLAESLFKRRAGMKDSGTLIPGHGGVLDRIDSLTAAGPCFAAGWLAAGGGP